MKSSQKVALSLLIAVVVFGGFTVVAFSGFFRYLEATFYNPHVRSSVEARLESASTTTADYVARIQTQFSKLLTQSSVKNIYQVNQSVQDIQSQQSLFGALKTEMSAFQYVRFIGNDGQRLYYSTLTSDVQSQSPGQIVYKSPDSITGTPALTQLALPQNAGSDIVLDPASDTIIFRFLVSDNFNIVRGTALFYVSVRGVSTALTAAGYIEPGSSSAVVTNSAVVLNLPDNIGESLRNTIGSSFTSGDAGAMVLLKNDNGGNFYLFSRPIKSFGYALLLAPEGEFRMQPLMQWVLLAGLFFTSFLLVFLLLNVRQDAALVLSERIKRFQIHLVQEYLERKEEIDWQRWQSELELRREEVSREIKRGIGPVRGAKAEQIDELINRSWDEILTILGTRQLQSRSSAPNIDLSRLEEMIQRAMSNLQNITVQAAEVIRPALPASKTQGDRSTAPRARRAGQETTTGLPASQPGEGAATAPQSERTASGSSAQPSSPARSRPIPVEVEAVEGDEEEIESLEEVEELEEAPEAAVGGTGEGTAALDDLEEAEEIAELEDAEEVSEPEEAGGTEDAEVAEEVEEADEAEAVEEAEEVSELEEAEEVADLDDGPETAEALEVDEVEQPSENADALAEAEPSDVNDAEELEEVAELEDAEEAADLDDVLRPAGAEGADEVGDADADEVGDADAAEVEDLEELGDLEEVEDLEEVGGFEVTGAASPEVSTAEGDDEGPALRPTGSAETDAKEEMEDLLQLGSVTDYVSDHFAHEAEIAARKTAMPSSSIPDEIELPDLETEPGLTMRVEDLQVPEEVLDDEVGATAASPKPVIAAVDSGDDLTFLEEVDVDGDLEAVFESPTIRSRVATMPAGDDSGSVEELSEEAPVEELEQVEELESIDELEEIEEAVAPEEAIEELEQVEELEEPESAEADQQALADDSTGIRTVSDVEKGQVEEPEELEALEEVEELEELEPEEHADEIPAGAESASRREYAPAAIVNPAQRFVPRVLRGGDRSADGRRDEMEAVAELELYEEESEAVSGEALPVSTSGLFMASSLSFGRNQHGFRFDPFDVEELTGEEEPEPVEVEEVPTGEEIVAAAEPNGDDDASDGSSLRFEYVPEVGRDDYDVDEMETLLAALSDANGPLEPQDDGRYILRGVGRRMNRGGRRDAPDRRGPQRTGTPDDVAASDEEPVGGIDELLSIHAIDLFPAEYTASSGESPGGPRARDERADRFVFGRNGLEYDQFLRQHRQNESGIVKSLVEITRAFSSRVGSILLEVEKGFRPTYSLGLDEACMNRLVVKRDTSLFREVLSKGMLIYFRAPLSEVPGFRAVCEESQFAPLERSMFFPITFQGRAGYLLLAARADTTDLASCVRKSLEHMRELHAVS